MDLFRTVIDGPYALLLVLQILIVSGLLLTLIWLFIYRSRELAQDQGLADAHPHPEGTSAHGATASSPANGQGASASDVRVIEGGDAPVVVTAGADALMDLTSATTGQFSQIISLGNVSGADSAQNGAQGAPARPPRPSSAPGEGIVEMQSNPNQGNKSEPEPAATPPVAPASNGVADAALLSHAQAETEELKNKIEFLEGKLLEYEIVQEEIASLSALKMENEQLREEVVQMQRKLRTPAPTPSLPGSGAENATPPPAEKPLAVFFEGTEPNSLLSPSETTEPSLSMGDGGPAAADFLPEPLPDNVIHLPTPAVDLNKAKQAAEAFEDPATNNQIEKILTKLEQLTTK